QLPRPLQERIRNQPPRRLDALRKAEGKWPDFLAELQRQMPGAKGQLDRRLFPTRPGELSRDVQQFLTGELSPKPGPKEKAELTAAQGRWRGYQKKIEELARRHNLTIPQVPVLPGPPEFWRRVR